MGRYDVEKLSAIEREDYDTAKQKKEQMDAYRLAVYHQLEIHNLLDISQVNIYASIISNIQIMLFLFLSMGVLN